MQQGLPAAVLVVGMHRSGTSSIAEALAGLGAHTGTAPLLGATAENPHGHWESEVIVDLHDDILHALDGDWASPPAGTTDRRAALTDLAAGPTGERAREVIDSHFPMEPWMWKDPRASLLLPFWREVLGDVFTIVLAVRTPGAIAESLCARDGFSRPYGLALWERYLRAALVDAAGARVIAVSYDDLTADPTVQLKALEHAVFGEDTGNLAAAVASVDRGVRRQLPDVDGLTPQQRALWEIVDGLIGVHDRFPTVDLAPESPGIDVGFQGRWRLVVSERERAELVAARRRLASIDDELDRERARLQDEIDRARADADHHRRRNEELEDILARQQAKLDLLTAARIRRPVQRWLRRLRR